MRHEVQMKRDPEPLHLCQQGLVWLGTGEGVTHCAKWSSYLESQLSCVNCPGHLKKREGNPYNSFISTFAWTRNLIYNLKCMSVKFSIFFTVPYEKITSLLALSDSWHHRSSCSNLLFLPERQKEEKMELVHKQHQLYDPLFRLFVSLVPFLAVSMYEIVLDWETFLKCTLSILTEVVGC